MISKTKFLIPVILALFLVTPGFAQDVTLPDKVEAKPGRIARIDAKTTAKEVVWIKPVNNSIDFIPIPSENSLIFLASQPGTYRIIAVVAKGDKASYAICDVVVSGSTPPPPPALPPPTNLQASSNGLSVTVRWSAPEGAVSYQIDRMSTGDWSQIATSTTPMFADLVPVVGTYNYRARAVYPNGASINSLGVSVVVTQPNPIPDVFTGKVVDAWKASPDADKANTRRYQAWFTELAVMISSEGGKSFKTVGDLRKTMTSSRQNLIGNSLRDVAAVIAADMNTTLPHTDDVVMDDAMRSRFAIAFTKYARALEYCK